MLATPCYTRDELQLYLLGRADDDLTAAIEGHLDACTRCDSTLSDIDAGDDTLVRTLQVKRDTQSANTPSWVAQMANMPFDNDQKTVERLESSSTDAPAELGDYELVSVLGRGGMSVVFSARHKHLGREVALKVLLPTNQQRAVSRDRFAREMRAVGGLDHAAIIRATDAGECNETLYLVMEQIDGVDLNRVSKAEGPLRVADACAIGIEVARGLAYAHDQGIVHRDIKPSNLMLDRNGNIKILDFGLARIQSGACDVSLQTTMGQLLGTLDYMAPEQASGCDVDARADIYALGATLFKLLVGAPPHGRSSEVPIIEFLNRLATNDATRLDEHRDQLPIELAEFVASMLKRDPEQRVASAEEVVQRLQPFAAGSNLSELATSAVEKVANSQGDAVASIKTSLTDLWSDPPPAGEVPKQQPPPHTTQREPIGPTGWAAIATGFMLFGSIALTIILLLRSPEGDIRIESELDNVRVEVVDEKDRVKVITVEQGAAITTLRAGRYRIRLDSPSDGIEVTPRDVIVTKGQIVIAKVTKIPAAKPVAGQQRPPVVAMEAQVQLAKTMDELAAAKRLPKPDAKAIKSLEEKLGRLRALSRPIPTEPVYEGRTLADWVAQMRFEQESGARKIAASNVLKLAVMRPDEEQMGLLMEAGSRLYGWGTRSLETSLYDEVRGGGVREYVGSSARRIMAVDRDIAADHLVRALQSDDQDQREFALTICVDLREQIRQGAWPGIQKALDVRSKSDEGAARVASQLTQALCVPDESRNAAALLMAINTDDASEIDVVSIMHSAVARKLEIPRDQELAWVSAYLDKLPFFESQRAPEELVALWIRPTFGPFRNADWNQVDVALQTDVNAAVRPLLTTFEQQLESVAEDPREEQRQLNAAIKSNVLTRIVNEVNLTGEIQQQTVSLLNRRLNQLLEFRDQHTEPPSERMDTPQRVAAVITLLTGEAPESIRRHSLNGTGFMAEQLSATRQQFSTSPNVDSIRGYSSAVFNGRRFAVVLADWYPYEMLTGFHEAYTRVRKENTSGFFRGGKSYGQIQTSSRWQIDTRLMLDFAKTSASAAAFVDAIMSPNELTLNLRRHPEFSEAATKFMEHADNAEAAELGFKIWKPAHSSDESDAKLREWLKSGDAAHSRFALDTLGSTQEDRFFGEWATSVAAAIDRVAKKEQLNTKEWSLLYALGDNAPQAGFHAAKYLKFWLSHPEEQLQTTSNSRRGGGNSLLSLCLRILLRSPEQAQQLKAELEQATKDPQPQFGATREYALLKQLVGRLSE